MANRYDKKPAARNSKKGLAKVMDLLFRANKARDAEELNDIINEAAEDTDFSAEGNVGNLDEMPDVKSGSDTHIHIHSGAAPKGEDFGAETTDEDGEEETGRATFADDAKNEADHAEFRSRLDAIEAKLGLSGAATDAGDDKVFDDGEELEEFLEEEKPEGIAAKDARKARDSRYLGESMKDTIAMAEILSPGIRVPTYDRASNPRTTAKKICGLRKQALDSAFKDVENRTVMNAVFGGKTLDTSRMTCDAIRTAFRSVAALKAQSNNARGTRDSLQPMMLQAVGKRPPQTIEEINAANAAYYASKK